MRGHSTNNLIFSENNNIDISKIRKLFEDGYIVSRFVRSLRELNKSDIDINSVTTNINTLTDPSNENKAFIILRSLKNSEQHEIITSDPDIIQFCQEYERYQHEPIGTLISVSCSTAGGDSTEGRVIELVDFINSINGFNNWEFKPTNELGNFEIKIHFDTTGKSEIKKTKDKVQILLDTVSCYFKTGFYMQHCDVSPIPRKYLTLSWGAEERSLQPIDKRKLSKMMEDISTSDKTRKVAHCLNLSFIETFLPSKVSLLWAAFEDLFSEKSKKQHLLTDEELDQLTKFAEQIESLKSDPEPRLGRLLTLIKDPQVISLDSRNRSLAQAVSDTLGLDFEDTFKSVKRASSLRGKHVHEFQPDKTEALKEAEKFLRKTLILYLKQEFTKKVNAKPKRGT